MGYDGKMIFSKINMQTLNLDWSFRLVDLVTPFNLNSFSFTYTLSTSID